jgi:hypothetical protein
MLSREDFLSDAEDALHGLVAELNNGVKQVKQMEIHIPELVGDLGELCRFLERAHCLAFFTKRKIKNLFLEEQSDLFFPVYQKTFTEDHVVGA